MAERLGLLPSQDFFSPLSGLGQSDPYIILSWAFAVASYFGFAGLAGYLTGLLAKRQKRLRQAYVVMTQRHETLLLLHRTSEALSAFDTAEEIADAILGELLEHLGLDRALLYRVADERTLALFMVKVRGADGTAQNAEAGGLRVRIPLEEGAGLTARAAVRQEAYNIADPMNSPHLNKELAQQIGMNPFAIAPLVIRGKTIGVIGIDRGAAGGIQREEFRILQVFANQAALTLHGIEPGAAVYPVDDPSRHRS